MPNEYKEKLIQFNSNPKYMGELDILFKSMEIKKTDRVLDYGCGTGRAVRFIRDKYGASAFGFDVHNYREENDPFLFRDSFHFAFDKIYFMHSIAHIPDVQSVLERLFVWALKPGGRVYVITPNRDFLDRSKKLDYIPDPTVKKHFNSDELIALFFKLGISIVSIEKFGIEPNKGDERLILIAEK